MDSNNHNSLVTDKYITENLGKINVILGKNGSGKSSFLREIRKKCLEKAEKDNYGNITYITPERGGILDYDRSIDGQKPEQMDTTRARNQSENFKKQSIILLKKLETYCSRNTTQIISKPYTSHEEGHAILKEAKNSLFENHFHKINKLLDNIELKFEKDCNDFFEIYLKNSTKKIRAIDISSGEAELITLAIECIYFIETCSENKENFLLLDEPDVHIHPDLQKKLCDFFVDLIKNDEKTRIILATHSTAILSALWDNADAKIAFMSDVEITNDLNKKTVSFKELSEEYRKILPIFGANPLSHIFNQTPIFLVEGEDDERIWQQAVRASKGKLKIYPCAVDGKEKMRDYEKIITEIINSTYDETKAYSLIDGDNKKEKDEQNHGKISRFQLSCCEAENLLLSNEVLKFLGLNWTELEEKIKAWIKSETQKDEKDRHKNYKEMLDFQEHKYDRKKYKIKKIRNDLMHIIGKNLSWEVAVGKSIGELISSHEHHSKNKDQNSIFKYLGIKLSEFLFQTVK